MPAGFEQKIKIADIIARVHCNNMECLQMVRDFYRDFLAEDGKKENEKENFDFAINLSFADTGSLPFPEDTKVIEDSERTYFIVKDLFGMLDKRTKTAGATIVNDKNLIPTFIRSIYLALFHEHGAALLHSSAYIERGKAHIFLGRSGAGKSTVARGNLGRKGITVVDEDMNIVRCVRGRFMLYANPFSGGNERAGYIHTRIPKPVELGSANILRKAKANSLKRAGTAEAVSTLLYCTYTTSNSAERCAGLIELYDVLSSDYAVKEFRFAKDRPYMGEET